MLPYHKRLLTRVDADGVPCVVQRIKYYYPTMQFIAILFDGTLRAYAHEQVCLSNPLDLLQPYPSDQQFIDAEEVITNLIEHPERWR